MYNEHPLTTSSFFWICFLLSAVASVKQNSFLPSAADFRFDLLLLLSFFSASGFFSFFSASQKLYY